MFPYIKRSAIIGSSFLAANLALRRTQCDDELVSFSPKEFRSFEITNIKDISHNTKVFTVALPSKDHRMGMVTAGCVSVRGPNDADGKEVSRPYTPTTLDQDKGSFDLLVKTYPWGIVSKYLFSLNVGDKIEVKGPWAKQKIEPNMKKSIGMVAGGTGLTPMLQVIMELLRSPGDKTDLTLIFANVTEEDILMKKHLDELAVIYPRFKVIYVCDKPADKAAFEKQGGYTGYVSEAIIKKHLAPASSDTLVFVCGPPGLMSAVSGGKTPDYKQGSVSGILKTLGYDESMVFKF